MGIVDHDNFLVACIHHKDKLSSEELSLLSSAAGLWIVGSVVKLSIVKKGRLIIERLKTEV